MDIVPEANFGIEKCKNETKERSAIFLCTGTDYMLSYQTIELPRPRQLFKHMTDNSSIGIVRE